MPMRSSSICETTVEVAEGMHRRRLSMTGTVQTVEAGRTIETAPAVRGSLRIKRFEFVRMRCGSRLWSVFARATSSSGGLD